MDVLAQTIFTLKRDEQKEFRAFIQRQRFRNERKDLELFDLLASGKFTKARDIAGRLYTPINMNAYHTLRKRLTKHLLEFVVLKEMDDDNTSVSQVAGMLSMAQFMLNRMEFEIAGKYLNKAADLAQKNEQYAMVNRLLGLQIQHATELGLSLTQLVGDWHENKRHADSEEKTTLAYSIIKDKLADAKLTGKPGQLQAITSDTMRQFGLGEAVRMKPSFLYKVAQITRSSVIATKEYYQFEPYVEELYDGLVSAGGFAKKDHLYHLWFLYMIAHVKYRNRNFKEALEFLVQLGQQLHAHNGIYFGRFYPKYVLLRAAVESYSGNNASAVYLLDETLLDPQLRLRTEDRLNMSLNLAVYHFQAAEYRKANRILLDINHTDHWMEKKMGKEWRFKKNLIEIILQVELDHTEIALNRIRSAERYFGGFLKNAMYQRAHIFMRFIRAVVEKPEVVATEEFAQYVDETIVRLPGDQEDIQAMTFYCWLKSKMIQRPYYDVLIETIQAFGKEA